MDSSCGLLAIVVVIPNAENVAGITIHGLLTIVIVLSIITTA